MEESNFITFRGKNLVRTGNIIFYGNMTDRYYTMLSIMEQESFEDVMVSGKIGIQLQYTDPNNKTILKKSEKQGLYQALDLASVWIDMANAEDENLKS